MTTTNKKDDPATELQGKLSPFEVRLMFEKMKGKKAPALSAGVQAPQESQDQQVEDNSVSE